MRFHSTPIVVLFLASLCQAQAPMLTDEEKKLEAEARQLNTDAGKAYQQGRATEAVKLLREAIAIRRKIYTKERFPDGHQDLAGALNNLGLVLQRIRSFDESQAAYEESLALKKKLYSPTRFPDGHIQIFGTVTNLASLFQDIGKLDAALERCQEGLAMARKLYPTDKHPDGHADIATEINRLASIRRALGQNNDALPLYMDAYRMRAKLFAAAKFPSGHPDLAASLNNLGNIHAVLGQSLESRRWFEKSLAMYRALYPNGHEAMAACLQNLSRLSHDLGQPETAREFAESALAMARKLYPAERWPMGHPRIVDCLVLVASAHEHLDQPEPALRAGTEALETARKLFPPAQHPQGHPTVAAALRAAAGAQRTAGRFEESARHYAELVDMAGRLAPRGNPDMAQALMGRASLRRDLADYSSALTDDAQAVAILLREYPKGHPSLINGLIQFGSDHLFLGNAESALEQFDLALEMSRSLFPVADFPNGNPLIGSALESVGLAHQALGSLDRSLQFHEQALAMYRKLYPADRPQGDSRRIIRILNNIGLILHSRSANDQSAAAFGEALALAQKLYPAGTHPDGHPLLATTLHNLAISLESSKPDEAIRHYETALAQRLKLFSAKQFANGHPDLARTLHNLGLLLQSSGKLDRALQLQQQALAMKEKLYPRSLYPQGHPSLAANWNSLGGLHLARGEPDRALAAFDKTLAIQDSLLERDLRHASEEQALDRIAALPNTLSGYLTAAQVVPDAAANAYRAVWLEKGSVMRLLSRRIAAARATGGDAVRNTQKQLSAIRSEIARVLSMPTQDVAPRDHRLVELADERERLERRLVRLIAPAKPERSQPYDLIAVLPERTAFVDFVRYRHFGPTGGEDRYLAFVLTRNSAIQMVSLGPAETIDAAIRTWRGEIEARQATNATDKLTQLVWNPIAAKMPARTDTLYFSPAGDLARLPWPALPVGRDRVLLDLYAVAQVPNGRFLLDNVSRTAGKNAAGSILAVGDLNFGASEWPKLPAARFELNALSSHNAAMTTLVGDDASLEKLASLTPSARHMHFATHGYYDADALAAERKRADEAVRSWRLSDAGTLPRLVPRNPLGHVGLVLSGGQVLSGLSVLDWDLDNVRLVTLSACETGLGQLTGGEGVLGLQRAFHLAGCPNVVASLWKVNDAATAALMAKFYHELWANKKAPVNALREAQLTIFRHPELILDLAGERGAPRLKAAVAVKVDAAAPAVRDHRQADTKLWAAFMLSGAGK